MRLISTGLKVRGTTPILKSALLIDSPDDVKAELLAIVNEEFEMMASPSRVLPVIEKCAVDFPELDGFYFGRRLRRHIELFVEYVMLRTKGGFFFDFSDATVTAQIVAEVVAWSGWKRLEGHDAKQFDDAACRSVIVKYVCHALIGSMP